MAIPTDEKISALRRRIQESLRVQLDTEGIEYIDASNNLDDATAKQNHVIFARRGCGKTLFLHSSSRAAATTIGAVYLNCEDFKQHSFPNVLIEILKSIFYEIDRNIHGWFGKRKKSKDIIKSIMGQLESIRQEQDEISESIKELDSRDVSDKADLALSLGGKS